MRQLHLRNTFIPVDPKTLSSKQKIETLESHLFLEEKRDGEVKGRMVAGGNKQREHVDKTSVISPTASTESIMITAVIDAKEARDVAIVDIPNSFVQKEVDIVITMCIHGKLAELLIQQEPQVYVKYVISNKNENLYYMYNFARLSMD